jgi:hypothetical protein
MQYAYNLKVLDVSLSYFLVYPYKPFALDVATRFWAEPRLYFHAMHDIHRSGVSKKK